MNEFDELKKVIRTAKQQRYSARRNAKRAGFSQEIVDEYLPLLDFSTFENYTRKDEVASALKAFEKNIKGGQYRYSNTDLPKIKKKTKEIQEKFDFDIKNVEERRKNFIQWYTQRKDDEEPTIEYQKLSSEFLDLPYPEYKNTKKFKEKAKDVLKGSFDPYKKSRQQKENILKSIDTVLQQAYGGRNPTKKELKEVFDDFNEKGISKREVLTDRKKLLKIRERIANMSDEDYLVFSSFSGSKTLLQIISSDQNSVIEVSDNFMNLLESFRHFKASETRKRNRELKRNQKSKGKRK